MVEELFRLYKLKPAEKVLIMNKSEALIKLQFKESEKGFLDTGQLGRIYGIGTELILG